MTHWMQLGQNSNINKNKADTESFYIGIETQEYPVSFPNFKLNNQYLIQ